MRARGEGRCAGDNLQIDTVKLQRSPRELARWQDAQQELLRDQPAAALAKYRGLLRRFPGVSQLWFELGLAAMGELNLDEAEQAFARAERLAPRDVTLLLALAQQYQRLRRVDLAGAAFRKAVEAEPDSVPARLSLAAWLERERKLEEAFGCVEAAREKQPRNPQVLCAYALLLHRQGKVAEAEAVLASVISDPTCELKEKAASRHLLAVILDEVGRYDEALRWLTESKAFARQAGDVRKMERDYDAADQQRRSLLAGLTPEMLRAWRSEGPAAPAPGQLVLLGGHPRSGTTLLEQILGVHPDIVAFDEAEAFVREIWHPLAPMPNPRALSASELDQLPASRRARLAGRYLKSLLHELPANSSSKVLLDKNPSPTAALHLWLRLFPKLKVLIALRDPRDVVISCFFQNLALTPTNANFLSLERTVKHYADLMDVWLRMRDLGGFDWLEVRYEDVVEDLATQGRRATEFIGLDWHPQQANHREVTRIVFSPTFSDVTKPVHNRAIGRWQRYAAALEPLQEHLAPYCGAFGYS